MLPKLEIMLFWYVLIAESTKGLFIWNYSKTALCKGNQDNLHRLVKAEQLTAHVVFLTYSHELGPWH